MSVLPGKHTPHSIAEGNLWLKIGGVTDVFQAVLLACSKNPILRTVYERCKPLTNRNSPYRNPGAAAQSSGSCLHIRPNLDAVRCFRNPCPTCDSAACLLPQSPWFLSPTSSGASPLGHLYGGRTRLLVRQRLTFPGRADGTGRLALCPRKRLERAAPGKAAATKEWEVCCVPHPGMQLFS